MRRRRRAALQHFLALVPLPSLSSSSLAGAATGFEATLQRAVKGKISHKDALAANAKRAADSAASGACESGRRERRRAACTGACWGRFEAAAAGG